LAPENERVLDPTPNTIARARRLVRSHHEATLLCDGVAHETRCLIDPGSGDLIVTVQEDALDADDASLAMPRDSFDTPVRLSVELLGDTSEEQRDRFVAYHLPSVAPRYALACVSFAKLDSGEVLERDQLALSNPLSHAVGALCRVLNEDRSRLSALCAALSGTEISDPLAVGVDDTGIDIRATHGIVRLELPAAVVDAEEARRVLAALLEHAGA